MILPAKYNFLHHTVTSDNATLADLDRIARGRGFDRVSYSFLVWPDGTIKAGRGWGAAQAATKGYNSVSHSIAAVGNYDTRAPTAAMVEAIADWHRFSITEGYTLPGPLRGHRDVKATACPGVYLYAALPTINGRQASNKETQQMNVKQLQADLNTLGAKPRLVVDGDYGPATKQAVVAYQRRAGLTPDGVAGPKTLGSIAASIKAVNRRPAPAPAPTPAPAVDHTKELRKEVESLKGRILVLESALASVRKALA